MDPFRIIRECTDHRRGIVETTTNRGTNCVSLALFFFAHIDELAFPLDGTPASLTLPEYTAGLAIYATSIVFGARAPRLSPFHASVDGCIHTILSDPDLRALVPGHDARLVSIKIKSIMELPGNLGCARSLFHATDFTSLTGDIYVLSSCTDPAEDNPAHLAMALDVAMGALSLSRCPSDLWPTTGADRSKLGIIM
ncbi:hypothetical protein DFH07DRAFT_1038267 [Mycena maculata]|uniref:Uncharacterized protein n=1 Tax=Mycena maculata TaxID=230809 RepID=A0AAD7IMC1_9AGAR|nr:hypothetical protein DFH07DRAFT_1038267 [Mycena maculata]